MDARFATYLGVAALLIVTPGPDMALVTKNALSAGARAGRWTGLGVGMGSVGWALASALGIGLLLERSVFAFTAVKLLGAGYLAILGIRSLFESRHERSNLGDINGARGLGVVANHAGVRKGQESLGPRSALLQGVAGNLINPKAAVIFVSVFPQFIQPGDSWLRLALMLVAYEALLLPWLTIYGTAVSRIGESRTGYQVRAWLRRATGVVLVALGLRLALEKSLR